MSPEAERFGLSRRRWVGLRWFLVVAGLVLLAVAARFMFHGQYPVGDDELYPLLYLQALVLALVVGSLSEVVKHIMKRPPSN